ncbi:hypothetical protein WJX72_010758 [[Myrmecia] bisecta]|uniref:Sugar phosphate transporter domain-containing protein n=1 Tax=[Myrmecia] bisecta TaxID=41462 RepID=A0AAW1QA69_9CHLO
MAAKPLSWAADGSIWVGNVASSCSIIFVNKVLMTAASKGGQGFVYATSLSALHFVACTVSIWASQQLGYVKRAKLPTRDLLWFTFVADLSIASCNLSLLLNPVALYQMAKLLVIPFICLVEYFWLKRTFTPPVLASIAVVIAGVAIVTLTNLSLGTTMLGLSLAAASVVCSGMQQILVRVMQQKHKLTAHELLSNTAQTQALTLLLAGPFLDKFITNQWVLDYFVTVNAAWLIGLSCFCAIGVNVFQFMCLGRFTAVSFQVLGHSKTVLVLLGGWFLGDVITARQLGGIVLAVSGMVMYGWASTRAVQKPKSGDIENLVPAKGATIVNMDSGKPPASAAPLGINLNILNQHPHAESPSKTTSHGKQELIKAVRGAA